MSIRNTKRCSLILCLLFFIQFSFARDYWGAIYVDETTGIPGLAWNHETDRASQKVALSFCKKKSRKKYCEPISSWSNSCSAAAWSPKNKSARTGGPNDDQKVAERLAMESCRRVEKDPSCKLVASVCTQWETVAPSYLIWW